MALFGPCTRPTSSGPPGQLLRSHPPRFALPALAEGEVLSAGIVSRSDADVLRARRAADAVPREPAHDAVPGKHGDGGGRHRADRGRDPEGQRRPRRCDHRLPRQRDGQHQAEEDSPEGDQHPGARAVIPADGRSELLVAQEDLAPRGLRHVDERVPLATAGAVAASAPGAPAHRADLQHASGMFPRPDRAGQRAIASRTLRGLGSAPSMDPASFDFFYDLASPYSYLASTQLQGISERTGARPRFYPITLGGVRKATGRQMPPSQQLAYMAQDTARWAQRYGVPLQIPETFAISTIL